MTSDEQPVEAPAAAATLVMTRRCYRTSLDMQARHSECAWVLIMTHAPRIKSKRCTTRNFRPRAAK
jgi:hypothetical protein